MKASYKKNDKIFLLNRNIKTIKLINKLKNKILIEKLYKLKLLTTIKMHNVFYFNLLYKTA